MMKETLERKVKRLMKQRNSARYHVRMIESYAKAKYEETHSGGFSWIQSRAATALWSLSDMGQYPATPRPLRRGKRKVAK